MRSFDVARPGPGGQSLARQAVVITALALAGVSLADGAPNVDLYIQSDGDFLAFAPDQLSVPAGAHVTLTFHHAGKRIEQMHDWVLLQPGTADEFMDDVLAAGENNDWMPPDDSRVIAATPKISPGESTTIEFEAPAAGDYPFVCTFEGHGAVMRGVLHVSGTGNGATNDDNTER
jgi:azurin